jgi:hypothetical protein
MKTVAFRLTNNTDPEERLEEAALWKAFYDFYGEEIYGFDDMKEDGPELPTFGRSPRLPLKPSRNPVSSTLDYWLDPAFKKHAQRSFWICDWNEAEKKATELQDHGIDVFIKSTRSKHFIQRIPAQGMSFMESMGDMAYSFIDGGPNLIVQEAIPMKYEHRFFVIDRKIVTDSPVQTKLTPIDYPLKPGSVSYTPNSTSLEINIDSYHKLRRIAEDVANTMEYPHASVDCAITSSSVDQSETGCLIEMNPMQIGQLGLYACNVRALAEASKKLIPDYDPVAKPLFTI